MYSSNDTARPLLRLIGLIASVVAFASLWSGDQKIQQEIAAARSKNRSVYAGPAVMQNLPVVPRVTMTKLAQQSSMPILGLLDRLPQGHYQLFDSQGRVGMLVLESRNPGGQGYILPVQQSLTIQTSYGEMRLKPVQLVAASSLIYR